MRDLHAADVFYKMLVRRCRKTELGQAADDWRWFPRLDSRGRPERFAQLPSSMHAIQEAILAIEPSNEDVE